MNAVRKELAIFNELDKLCSSPGYAHVIAYFCFRDNMTSIYGELKAEDLLEIHKPESLIRTEISTLVGLLVKNKINLTLADPDTMQSMIYKTEALLNELHQCLSQPLRSHIENPTFEQSANPFSIGTVLREPIFYNGESAYDFQYLDFSSKKYVADEVWLKNNKGFSIKEATEVILNIIEIHKLKLLSHLEGLRYIHPDCMTMLPAFIFTSDELKERLNINHQVINNVLSAFCIEIENKNDSFSALNDFNISNAFPLIPLDNNQYLLFQHYSLVESLYESPFYWMSEDRTYVDEAMKNRGDFIESFSAERLRHVFGDKRVFSNINIFNPKAPNKGDRGEIDVLVLFGNRAIILQAKSKRLTINAKKGNDNVIKNDFKASIQDAYDQGFQCAKLLSNEIYVLVDSNSNKINIPNRLSEIYVFCVISDHYPALNFQSQQFLKWQEDDIIKPPFVMDIFFLDVMTEMIQSPLYLLYYINRRTSYLDKILAPHEITTLSFFMKNNTLLEGNTFLTLHDSISNDIDSAMMARRLGIPGKTTPDGAMAHLMSGQLGKILKIIGEIEDPVTIELGFLLLGVNSDSAIAIEKALRKILKKSKRKKSSVHFSISFEQKEIGLTVHSNRRPDHEAKERLRRHCEKIKYSKKAKSWYGLHVNPNDRALIFVIKSEYPWIRSNNMDSLVGGSLISQNNPSMVKKKIGVNDPCPCGSGIKFKKCCRK